MDEWIIVTRESHPNLFLAFETISHDSGGGAGHDNYSVHLAWQDNLPAVETALAGLTGDREASLEGEFTNFCIGETTEIMTIAARSSELTLACACLNSFFSDWDKGPEGEELS